MLVMLRMSSGPDTKCLMVFAVQVYDHPRHAQKCSHVQEDRPQAEGTASLKLELEPLSSWRNADWLISYRVHGNASESIDTNSSSCINE